MSLTVAIEGKGVIANCDALTNDTGGTGTGDWSELGGGSISLTEDTFLYGSSCIAGAYSNKSGWQRFDIGAGNELDFDTSGAEEGQHIYMWIHCPTIGLLETKANKGLAIRLGTSATDYREYLIAGSDDANGWNGGWKCFVIDPTKAGSVSDTGTYDYGSIRYVGIWIETAGLAKGDNIFIDQVAVGFGLRITGTSTTSWKDAVDYCTDYPNRAWGMFQDREGIYYAYGKILIGESGQSSATSFTDTSRIIQFGKSEYWNGSAWVTLADIDYSGIVIEDASGYSTTFRDGVASGSSAGRSGSTIIGNANHNVSLNLYGGNEATSLVELYGTSLKNITGAINFGDDADHKIYSVIFEGCAQVNPVGSPKIRNSLFIATNSVDSALLWNENIDIQNINFIANTLGAGIEMPSAAGTPYAYNALFFSGNTYDVLNSSGSAITINKNNLSDPTTYEGSTVTFAGVSVTTKIIVKDVTDLSIVENARVLLEAAEGVGPLNFEESVSITRSDSTATVSHAAHGLATDDLVHIKGCDQPEYNIVAQITVTGVDAYTYTVNGTPATPATGSPTSTTVIFNTLTNASGFVTDVRTFASNQNVIGRVRRGTSVPLYKSQPITGEIDKDVGLTLTTLLIPDE